MIKKILVVVVFFVFSLGSAFYAKLSYISNPNWVAAYIPSSYKNHEVINLVVDVGAEMVRGTDIPNIYILHADTGDLRAQLKRRGIWLTLDPIVLKGCGLTGDWQGPY